MSEPYWDTEPDVDVPIHSSRRQGVCAMCGATGDVFEGAVELPIAGGFVYELGLRCFETARCRERRRGVKSSPPIPHEPEIDSTPASAPQPMEPPLPPEPDEEAPVVDYF